MCSRPETIDGKTFACRTCNECIATRRHNWVARAMMEKAYYKHALCLALTYDNKTQDNRDAAQMFAYVDVRAFLKRLRAALVREGLDPELKFLVAGEQGSRNGRCHWHMILYSNSDVTSVGKIAGYKSGKYQPLTDLADMVTVGSDKRRLHWSLWGHGYVSIQMPDQGGMNYVLSYCLKDQFTHEKSKGTMREAKAENFATGLFRMSKRPAIGERFIFDKLQSLLEVGAVMPNLNIKVPGFHGYYHPSGSFRKKILWALVALNQRIVWDTGRNAPQWSSLLASLADSETDMGVLTGVKGQEEETEFEFKKRLRLEGGENARKEKHREFRRQCGRLLPCLGCRSQLHPSTLHAFGLEQVWNGQEWVWSHKDGPEAYAHYNNASGNDINPACLKRGSVLAREVYPASKRHDK